MDQLWAPWRLNYAAIPKRPGGPECFICRVDSETADRENLVVARSQHSVVVLNRFPYNNGHVLVCPRLHQADLAGLPDAVLLDLQHQLVRLMAALRRVIRAEGFNVGLNLGAVAGAGVPGHLHWHIVPRWAGDTNFMPVLADTKVIVQSLEALYDVLVPELAPAP